MFMQCMCVCVCPPHLGSSGGKCTQRRVQAPHHLLNQVALHPAALGGIRAHERGDPPRLVGCCGAPLQLAHGQTLHLGQQGLLEAADVAIQICIRAKLKA